MGEPEPFYAAAASNDLPPLPRHPIHVVLDNLRSAFNVGSIFRTGDGAAVAHIHLCGMTAHPPHLKLQKTALGAFTYVPWTYHERTRDCIAALKAQGIPVVAVEIAPGSTPLMEYAWPQPVAVVFGNEVDGVPARILELCDATVHIPMFGHKNSMNVATAAGVVLYGILHQWSATR